MLAREMERSLGKTGLRSRVVLQATCSYELTRSSETDIGVVVVLTFLLDTRVNFRTQYGAKISRKNRRCIKRCGD
jgi:hypothetical protein